MGVVVAWDWGVCHRSASILEGEHHPGCPAPQKNLDLAAHPLSDHNLSVTADPGFGVDLVDTGQVGAGFCCDGGNFLRRPNQRYFSDSLIRNDPGSLYCARLGAFAQHDVLYVLFGFCFDLVDNGHGGFLPNVIEYNCLYPCIQPN